MQNEYRYIDTDSKYIDPKTGVLRNIVGITDYESLTFAEAAATVKRSQELRVQPIPNDIVNGVVDAIHGGVPSAISIAILCFFLRRQKIAHNRIESHTTNMI